jgi:hypothetical protein
VLPPSGHLRTVAASNIRHATRSGVSPDTNILRPRRIPVLAAVVGQHTRREVAEGDQSGSRSKPGPRRPIR